MPYPLEKLQYGLRQRLRQLATRSEAYVFQIAAPNYSGFQPIQNARSLTHAMFIIYEENKLHKMLYPEQPKNLHDVPLYIVSTKLTFENITPEFNLNPILDDYRFAPKYVHFYDCCLDETFIKSFVNNVNSPIKSINLCPTSFASENAAKMLCNSPVFTTLECFTHYAQLSVFEIDKEVFLKFIKAQRDDFILRIYMSINVEWHSTTEQRLKNLFDERFERCVDVLCAQKKKAVFILFDKEEYRNLRRFYVFRDD